MKLLYTLTALVIFLNLYTPSVQQAIGSGSSAITPSFYSFSIYEDAALFDSVGIVYSTSNIGLIVNYTISDSTFAISSSGVIFLSQNLDYETNSILDTSVSDNANNGANIHVCILDINDNIPYIFSQSSITITTSSNQIDAMTVIWKFLATDADSNENSVVTFSLASVGGGGGGGGASNDNNKFSITSNGILMNTSPLNSNNSMFQVEIVVTDGGTPRLSNQFTFSLAVDRQTDLVLDKDLYVVTIDEDVQVAALFDAIPPSTDPELELLPTPANFRLNTTTGQLIVLNNLDYESQSSYNFSVVNASDTSITLAQLVIFINNVIDMPPQFNSEVYELLPTLTIAGSVVFCPSMVYGEEDAVVTFDLFSDFGDLFSIDSSTGIIILTRSILYDPSSFYRMLIQLTDRSLSRNTSFVFFTDAPIVPLPSEPVSLFVASNVSDFITWQQPVGIYPLEVFTRGLSYILTYQPLSNLSDVHTVYSNSTTAELYLDTGSIYFVRVAAALLESKYGSYVVITISKGNENAMAAPINSTAIHVSWDELQYCFSNYTIQYQIIYSGIDFDVEIRTITLNIADILDPITNTTSCTPQSVLLTNLTTGVNYSISLWVSIDELGVNDVFIAELYAYVDLDYISINPDYPICADESVAISCLILSEKYRNVSTDFVYFSFNYSTPLGNEINFLSRTDNGIDITNVIYQLYNPVLYLPFIFGQIVLISLSEVQSTIEFGCHLMRGNESFTDALVTTKLEKAVPPPKPECGFSRYFINFTTCYLNIYLVLSPVSSRRPDISYYLKENGVTTAVISNNSTSSFLFDFSTQVVPSVNLNITLSAGNCAGESNDEVCTSILIPGYQIQNYSLFLVFDEGKGSISLYWNLTKVPSNAPNISIPIGYSIQIDFNYLTCNVSSDYEDDYYYGEGNRIYREANRTIVLYSDTASYSLDIISPPTQLLQITIDATIEIIQQCGENETERISHTDTYDYYYESLTPPLYCDGTIDYVDPYTCNATHYIQWQLYEEETGNTLFFNNQSSRVEIFDETDFRRIQPNASYNYLLVANATCGTDSQRVCYESIIPAYEFDPTTFVLLYSPTTYDITANWSYIPTSEEAAAHVVDIHIRVSITFEYKVANQDVQVAFYELNVTHLSNITNSTFLSPTAPQTLEILNLNVSLQIIEQCGFILNNKNFTITYSYFRAFIDSDNDGYPYPEVFCDFLNELCEDNCPTKFNPNQEDCDSNGIGDACDTTCEMETDIVFSYNWTCTKGSVTQYRPCIQGSGVASRKCLEYGEWSDIVDTSNCFTPEYVVFNKENVTIDDLKNVADVVAMVPPATGGDVSVIVNVLNTTIEAALNANETVLENIVNDTLKVVDILASDSNQKLLEQSQPATNVGSMVINIMAEQARSLALNQDKDVLLATTQNVFIGTQKINVTQSDALVINAINIQGEKEGQATPSVIVPIPENIDKTKSLSVSVVVIKNIGKLINTFADTISVGTGGIKLSAFSSFVIVSPVISVQLFSGNDLITGDGANTLVELSVPLSLSGIDLTQNYIKPTCLALPDAASSNPEWNDQGIQNVSSNDITTNDIVTCLPSHTTPFVVLVGVGSLESQSVVLNILSYVGCSLSVICLLISLIIYLLFGRKLLRKIYHFVHFQLALSLCLLYLVFLFGVEPAYANVWLYIPCKLVTVAVEYLLLVVFLWMLMEGLVVLIMIMLPFHQFGWKHFVLFFIVSWGIPLLYVVPFIPFFHEYYVSPPIGNSSIQYLTSVANYCFIHNDETTNLILSVTVPLAVIIILNVVFLVVVVIRCMFLILKQRSLSKLQRAQKTSLRLLRLLIVMFPVLGFGWISGLLAIYFNTTVFAWMFTILCAFQGIFFLFFVLLIRSDIQKSILSALNLKATILTMQSRISSQFARSVSTKESQIVTKQTLIFVHPKLTAEPDLESPPSNVDLIESKDDLKTLTKLFLAKESGLFPPTVELEDMLMFYEDRHWSQEPEFGPDQNEYLFDKIAKDLDEIATQITEIEF